MYALRLWPSWSSDWWDGFMLSGRGRRAEALAQATLQRGGSTCSSSGRACSAREIRCGEGRRATFVTRFRLLGWGRSAAYAVLVPRPGTWVGADPACSSYFGPMDLRESPRSGLGAPDEDHRDR
jgi:hypothetical protein